MYTCTFMYVYMYAFLRTYNYHKYAKHAYGTAMCRWVRFQWAHLRRNTCIRTYINVYRYVYTYIYRYVNTYMYVYMLIEICETCVGVSPFANGQIFACFGAYTYAYVSIDRSIDDICIRKYIYMYIYIWIGDVCIPIYIYMYIHMCIFIYIYIRIYVYMYKHICISKHVYIYTYMHIYIFICMYTWIYMSNIHTGHTYTRRRTAWCRWARFRAFLKERMISWSMTSTAPLVCLCLCLCVRAWYRTFEWVVSHIWMSHFTHMRESGHTYEWVMSYIWISHVTRMNVSCHVCEWVTSHIRMSHVTHMTELIERNPPPGGVSYLLCSLIKNRV